MSDTDEQRKQDEAAIVEGHLRRRNEQDGQDDDQAPGIELKQDAGTEVEGHLRRLNEQEDEDDDQAANLEV